MANVGFAYANTCSRENDLKHDKHTLEGLTCTQVKSTEGVGGEEGLGTEQPDNSWETGHKAVRLAGGWRCLWKCQTKVQ